VDEALEGEMVEWQYAVALHRFRVEGDSEAAQAALDRASSANAHVLRFLANDTPLPACTRYRLPSCAVRSAIHAYHAG
jgi:hypothetical protein